MGSAGSVESAGGTWARNGCTFVRGEWGYIGRDVDELAEVCSRRECGRRRDGDGYGYGGQAGHESGLAKV
jgi:hypothetical protein